MDFASILKSQIQKDQDLIERSKKRAHSSEEYVKAVDIEETRREDGVKKRRTDKGLDEEADEKECKSDEESDKSDDQEPDKLESDKSESEKSESNKSGSDKPGSSTQCSFYQPISHSKKSENLTKAEISLRKLKQPIRKYGETDDDVIRRCEDALKDRDLTSSVKSAESIPITVPKINKNEIATNLPAVLLECREYIKYLLNQWEAAGDPDNILQETKMWLVPLLVSLKRNRLEPGAGITLSTLLNNLQAGELNAATENYVKLSVGNVAWPIGVQSVSIHQRNSQSHLNGEYNGVSNIMKDEKTRKWILAIKRLISFVSKQKGGSR